MLIGVGPQAYWLLSPVNYLGLRHLNHRLTLFASFFSFVQTSFRELGEVGLSTFTYGIKGYQKNWSGSLAKRRLCFGPASIINCTHYQYFPSEWVSLPECVVTTFGALAGKRLTLRRQVPSVTTPRPCSSSRLDQGRSLVPLEGFCFSMSGPFMWASSGWQQGNWVLM